MPYFPPGDHLLVLATDAAIPRLRVPLQRDKRSVAFRTLETFLVNRPLDDFGHPILVVVPPNLPSGLAKAIVSLSQKRSLTLCPESSYFDEEVAVLSHSEPALDTQSDTIRGRLWLALCDAAPTYVPRLEPDELYVCCFGGLRLFRAEGEVKIELSHRPFTLLMYLIFHPGGIQQDVLARCFWSYGGGSARNALHQTIHVLKRALEKCTGNTGLISCQKGVYRLHPRVRSDYQTFKRAMSSGDNRDSGQSIDSLINLYVLSRLPLVADLDAETNWLQPFRRGSFRLRIILLEKLIECCRAESEAELCNLLTAEKEELHRY